MADRTADLDVRALAARIMREGVFEDGWDAVHIGRYTSGDCVYDYERVEGVAVTALATALQQAEAALAAERERREAAERERDAALALLGKAAPYTCPECGPYAKVDEDECCVTCGLDATLSPQPGEGAADPRLSPREDGWWCVQCDEGFATEAAGRAHDCADVHARVDAALSPGEGAAR